MEKSNLPKLAFYYCLSLVTLIIGSVSLGIIISEIINNFFPLISTSYYTDDSGLKSAISGVIIAFPIYYFVTSLIYKGISKQEFDIEAGPRKWLTYFIILVSSVVMIGSLISLLNNFLDGETTINFVLHVLSILGISSTIFTFYFNDIKNKEVNKKFNMIYFICSLLVIIIAFVTSFFIVESPNEARNRKLDEKVINNLDAVKRGIDQYYIDNKKLPQTLEDVSNEKYDFLTSEQFVEVSTGKYYGYNPLEEKKYELCALFNSSNMENNTNDYYYSTWKHDMGYQCITKRVEDYIK